MQLTRFENKLIYAFALTCSMNALMIFGISISNYILGALLIYHIIKYRYNLILNFNTQTGRFSLFFTISIVLSIFLSLSLLPLDWIKNSISCGLKFILAFGYLFILQPSIKINDIRNTFFDGFYIGAIVQLLWGFLQVILYFGFHVILNEVIFKNILNITQYNWASFIDGNIIRMTGLGWEPANFALVIIIGYILALKYKGQKIIALLFLIALLLSTSRSGYLAMAAVFVFQIFQSSFNINKKININLYKTIEIVSILFLMTFIFVKFSVQISNRIQIIQSQFLDVITNFNPESSTAIHTSYYQDVIDIMRQIPIINVIFGAGYFSTGYYYSQFNSVLLSRLSLIGWNPESDFITLLLGNGLVGIVIYYGYAIRAFIINRKEYIALIVVAIITCGFTYLTIRGTWSLLFICFSLIGKTQVNMKYSEG